MTRLLPPSLLVLAFCLALVARIGMSLRPGLWGDEIFSLAMATGHSLEHPAAEADSTRGDFVDPPGVVSSDVFSHYAEHDTPPAGPNRVIRAVILSDTSPPLYYLMLYAWTRLFGTGDTALRLLSVLFATLAAPFIWMIGRELDGSRMAWTATVLYAFSPVSLFYSLEGRMYSLLWLLASAIAWLTLRLSRRGATAGLGAGWIAVSAAGLLTHYFFLFVWAAMLAWLLLRPVKLSRGSLLLLAGLVGLAVLPWYRQVPASLGRWRVTGDWLAHPLSWPGAVTRPFELAWSLLAGGSFWGGSSRVDACLAAGYLVLALWIVKQRLLPGLFVRDHLVLWLWLVSPIVGVLAFDAARHTSASYVPRYVLGALPAAMLLAALGMEQLKGRAHSLAVMLVLAAWTAGLWPIVSHRARPGAAYHALAAELDSQPGGTDLVLVHSIPSGVIGLSRYLLYPIPMVAWIEQLGARTHPNVLDSLTLGRRRVALVQVHNMGQGSLAEPWLRSHARLVRETVYEFDTDTLTADVASLPPPQQLARQSHQLIEVFYFAFARSGGDH